MVNWTALRNSQGVEEVHKSVCKEVNGGGKTCLACGQHHPMSWSPALNEKGKRRKEKTSEFFLCFLQM